MNSLANSLNQRLAQSKWLPMVVILLALGILGTSITLLSRGVEDRIQAQIVGRDAEVLHAISLLQQRNKAERDENFSIETEESRFNVLLESATLKGVMAVRLFNARGGYETAFPDYVLAQEKLSESDQAILRREKPVSHFHPNMDLKKMLLSSPDSSLSGSAPILEVIVPFHGTNGYAGAAQYLITGQAIADEFASLREVLVRQGMWIFGAGGVVLVVTLGWTFHRLQRSNRQLQERTVSLLHANQELALAAKTSAVGAITANLMHGLKSPLFGLQYIVASRTGETEVDTQMQSALDTTRRMQSMINKVMDVLREERGMQANEISLFELGHAVGDKLKPLAEEMGITLLTEVRSSERIPARVANLVILVLANLLQNAIEATPRGRTVRLSIEESKDGVHCVVRDEGPGIPSDVRSVLFTPCKSSKQYGSGIGLSISKQLANHLGADLYLEKTTSAGSTFVLALPARLLAEKEVR